MFLKFNGNELKIEAFFSHPSPTGFPLWNDEKFDDLFSFIFYLFVYLFVLTTLMPGLIHSLTDWPTQSITNTAFQAYDKIKGKVPVCLLCHFRVNKVIKGEAMSMQVQQGESYCLQLVVLPVGWTSAILIEELVPKIWIQTDLFIVYAHAWNLNAFGKTKWAIETC